MPQKKKPKARKPGLVFPGIRFVIEPANNRMKSPCNNCRESIRDKCYRIKMSIGSGRHAKSLVLCPECGLSVLGVIRDSAKATRRWLKTGLQLDKRRQDYTYAFAELPDLRVMPLLLDALPKADKLRPKQKI